MNMFTISRKPIAIVLLALIASLNVRTALGGELDVTSAMRINEANQSLRSGDLDAALSAYAEVAQQAGEREELAYNKAVALFKKGELEAAESLFSSVSNSANDELAAKSRFNAGNCDYATALELRQNDRDAAMERLKSAISKYRSALDVDPKDVDSRVNIELAAKLLDQLQQEKQQEQQEQDQQQQDQQQQEQQQQDQSSLQDSQMNQEKNSEADAGDKEETKQPNEPPQGEVTAANQPEDEEEIEEENESRAIGDGVEGEMTEEEARKMLQAIRDHDMLRRLRREAAERERHVPVDKDW